MSASTAKSPRFGVVNLYRTLYSGKDREILTTAFWFIAKSLPVWFMPIATSRMIDLIVSGDLDTRVTRLFLYSAGIIILVLQNIPSHVTYTVRFSQLARGVGRDLRIRICRQLQALTLNYHNRTSVGKLHSKAIRDIEMLENVPRMFAETVVAFILGVSVAIIYISFRQPWALAVFAVAVPITALIRTTFLGLIHETVGRYRKSMEGMSSSLADMMTMIPVTRAHGLEEEQIETVQTSIQTVFHKGREFDRVSAIFHSVSWVALNSMNLLFLTGSIYAAFAGYVTVGDVVLFNTFFMQLSGYLTGLLSLVPQLSQARESIQSVQEILNAPDLEHNDGKPPVEDVEGGFELRHVSMRYPDTSRSAVVDISLTVKPGECIAFVGPSGSGKTTILSLLLGFVRPDSGVILLDGRDMNEIDLRTYRRHVGVVTQDTVFFSGTLKANVAYGMDDVSEDDVIIALRRANALEFVENLPDGIETRLGTDGVKLSGGQQQRLAIARALIRNPRVLLLDEATSALDTESEELVQEALERVMCDRTTFLVAHRISTVRTADRIIVLEAGSIDVEGTHEQLMQSDNFYSRAVSHGSRKLFPE